MIAQWAHRLVGDRNGAMGTVEGISLTARCDAYGLADRY